MFGLAFIDLYDSGACIHMSSRWSFEHEEKGYEREKNLQDCKKVGTDVHHLLVNENAGFEVCSCGDLYIRPHFSLVLVMI